ncbi:MAG: biotin--[acetyl-CoA-carboxylase] ligase [Bacteroidota bacterium]
MCNINVIFLAETDSTNLEAWRRIKAGTANDKTLIWTKNQKSGKGAANNSWESEADKNLAATYILNPDFLEVEEQFYLNKCISLAVRDSISLMLNRKNNVFIKWPNDIFINDRKIAGILIENSIMGDKITKSVIGIGINVNQKKFSKELVNAISLSKISEKEHDIEVCLKILSEQIKKWWDILKLKEFDFIDKTYLNHLYLYRQTAKFKSDKGVFEGKITAISKYGQLRVVSSDNVLHEFNFKEVVYPV